MILRLFSDASCGAAIGISSHEHSNGIEGLILVVKRVSAKWLGRRI